MLTEIHPRMEDDPCGSGELAGRHGLVVTGETFQGQLAQIDKGLGKGGAAKMRAKVAISCPPFPGPPFPAPP